MIIRTTRIGSSVLCSRSFTLMLFAMKSAYIKCYLWRWMFCFLFYFSWMLCFAHWGQKENLRFGQSQNHDQRVWAVRFLLGTCSVWARHKLLQGLCECGLEVRSTAHIRQPGFKFSSAAYFLWELGWASLNLRFFICKREVSNSYSTGLWTGSLKKKNQTIYI